MKRKRVLLIFGCLAGVLLAAYATGLFPRWHRITNENIGAIRDGMTEREVEAILGAPAGDYSSGTSELALMARRMDRESWNSGAKIWVSDEAGIYIRFDERGKAVIRMSSSGGRATESFFTKLRHWLGM